MSTPTPALARRVIELAGRAPSVHNTQPWRWRLVDATRIELRADRTRQLRVSDAPGRNLAMSCGAALHHAYVAARALGLTPDITLLPSPADPDLMGRIGLTRGAATEADQLALQALEVRCTDRRRFTSWPIPDSRLAHLATAASGWGAHVVPLTDMTARFRVEDLLRHAMAVQAADPRIVEEQHEWTEHSRADGIPVASMVPPAHGRPPTRPNRFAPQADTESAGRTVESTDGLVAICTAADDQRSWLQSGQTLSAVWLRATQEGLSVVPLSQPVEVEETRQAMHHDVFEDLARPQIVMRIGWLESTRPPLDRTPRRPVDDIIEH